ncbi:hypothetical protein AAKU67_004446 [Oxalobacteraceae bacterium GrIS 2.11]
MAIYHFSVKVISRSSGRSATAAAAYRAGETIRDQRTGLTFSYLKKEVSYRRIFIPPNAPQWMKNRERLWNAVEVSETRKDAQTAKEIVVALPVELSPSHQIILLERFVHAQITAKGMVADVVIHNKNGNPHAHILLTLRAINVTNDGFGKKMRDLNDKEQLMEWREQWAKHCNRRLFVASNTKSRIDHRSLKDQGLDQIPTVHLGANCNAMDNRGIASKRKQLNILIKEKNMSNNKLNPAGQFLKNQPATSEQQKVNLIVPNIKDGLLLTASDFQNHKNYYKKMFSNDYIASLQKILTGTGTSIDYVQTTHGECYRINLGGGGAVFDYGNQIKVQYGSDDEVKVAVMLAVEKRWKGICLTGSDDFKEAAFYSGSTI